MEDARWGDAKWGVLTQPDDEELREEDERMKDERKRKQKRIEEQRIYSIVDGKISSTSVVKETAKRFYVDGNKTTSFYDHYKAIPKNEACLTVEAAVQRQIEILHAERAECAEQIKRAKEGVNDIDDEIESLIYTPCQNCNATGAVSSPEPSAISECCPDCLEQGICPQCGSAWCENVFAEFDAFMARETSAFNCPHCRTKIYE